MSKPPETFGFPYQPSLDERQVTALASTHFIAHGESLAILGPPAWARPTWVALGLKAIAQGYRVLLATAAAPLNTLSPR